MIPVRVPARPAIHTVGGTHTLTEDQPLYWEHCPVCDFYLGMKSIALVYVGVLPEDRKSSGWTTGAAVAVHAECTGVELADQSELSPQ